MNLDVDSDEEGKGNSQELFLEDVLEPSPPEEAGRTVRGNSADHEDTILEDGRKEAVNDRENAVEDVCNGMLEVEGQFDDIEEVEASDQTISKRKDNISGIEIPAEDASPQILNKGTSLFKEQRNESETKEALEVDNAESGNKTKISEEQLTDAGEGVEDGRENVAAGDEDEIVLRRGKKRESLKDKMRNKDGLTAGETENIALNDPQEHMQSDWELALKLAQEFGSVPPDLDVRHSKRVNRKNDVNSTGRKGRKMRQLQIQNVPDVAESGQHSRRGRSRHKLRSNVAEESDDVTIESFQDDSRGDASGKNQRKGRQAKNERKVKGNVKTLKVDVEEESSSVQCVPETPHVGAKVTRGGLSNGKKKAANERKKESDADVESEDEDGESKTVKPISACKSREKVSKVAKKQQKSEGSCKENGGSEMSNAPADDGEIDDESTEEGGRRRSSRLSKSQEKKINLNNIKGTEQKRKVDSDAGMKEEVKKEMTPKGKVGENGKRKRKSGRLSKSQEESNLDERKDSRKCNSEGDAKKKEAEGVVIVVDDQSDEEDVDGDIGQGKRMSARLLTKSQEKKMEKNVVEGDFSGKVIGGRESQGRTGKNQTASALEERGEMEQNLLIDDEDEREESGQKRRSLRKKKEDGTAGETNEQKRLSQYSDKVCERLGDNDVPTDDEDVREESGQKRRLLRKKQEDGTAGDKDEQKTSQYSDKNHKSLGDNDGLKESCVGTKGPDAVPSQRKSRRGSNVTEGTPQMNKTTRIESTSSLKSTRAARQTQSSSGDPQAFSTSTTESIELDSNPTFAQPDGDFLMKKSPRNKNIGAGKTQRKRKNSSEEDLLLSGVEKVDTVAKEEGTGDRESHSFEGTRKSKRNRGELKELDKNKKNSFNENKKKSSEPQDQKRLVQEKNKEKKGGSLGLVDEESKTDVEVEEGGAKRSAGLGKSKLRSRSSGRKGKVTSGVENFKDGSSSIQDEVEEAEEPVRRNTRRQKKDVIVKCQAEDETLRVEHNEEEACENVGVDQNKKEESEVVQCEDGQKEEEPKPKTETGKESVAVEKGDPTSPDIFTMHMEASEQDRGSSIGRSSHEEEPRKETGAYGEGDGGETPKTSKRKKKKRKTFSFGNEANLVNTSLIDDGTGMTVRDEAEKSSREVSRSESTTGAGLELTEDATQNKDDSSLGQFVPATLGASESHGNLSDQIPIPRQLNRQKNEESRESLESKPKVQNQKCEKEDSFSEEVVSVRRISSLKSRGKRQVAKRNEDSEMSNKRFCSDSQFSGEEESMVPPTPPVTASHCQTGGNDGSSNASECNSLKEDITDGETTSKEDSLVQAFEKVKRCEEKAIGSNQDDKIASSLSSPSISLFQDAEITGEQEVVKDSVREVAEPSIGGKSPGAIDQSETGTRVPGKKVEGKDISEKENESHGSSPEDLPDVLGEDATSGRRIEEDRVLPEMSKHSDADLNRDGQEETEDKDKFVQPYNKHFDEEEPLFDDEGPVSPASSIGRHNLTSASSVLSSQSDLMTSQQHDNAKRVLENMEKEIAEMERALAEEEEMEAVSEKKEEVSDEDEEEAGEKEGGEVTKGKQQRGDDVINTSQEAKYGQEKEGDPVESVESISFEGVDSINLSSDEDEGEVSKKRSEGDRGKRRKTPDRRSSGYGRTGLKKYGKYEKLTDIDDKDIAQNVKDNLTEMAEAEKSLDSLLKAHAARRRENEEEEEEEKELSGSGDEDVDVDRPSTPPAPSPSSSPPRSPSPAPLLSQRTLTRRLSPLQKNIQKAEEIVKSFSEERPVTSQKRRRVVIEDSDSESEDEVQYRNKRKKSLKLDSPESYEADEQKVKGQPGGQKVESPCNVRSPTQKYRKETSPKTAVEKRDVKAEEVSPEVGGVQHNSPERKKVTTPQTSSSGSGGSSSKKRPRKGEMMSLVATGLNKHKLKMVDQLCKKAGCKFSSVFIPSTTHIIVNAGENLTCERTLKYFQGIAARRWVISFQWVEDSLTASRLLPLEKYEIRGDSVNGQNHCGPRRARLWKGPPLLGDYNLFCLEPFTGLNKDQLEGLLKACGGSVYQHPSRMPQEDDKENFIIAQHDVQEEKTDYQALYEKFQVKVISREWVLDSIAVYTTQPITDYLLCDVTECDDAGELMSDDEF
ncbi:Breast cancer type 1 susceptibility protein-like [Holothuria leucospilota]|uniref:Breast cancer type 1 susceptibility protein-like n=1 Tax=Holothuria leucospilota TaxID=206669 RepID=A0A9Q0YP61_HOLLE|nr:Breast cancer type 1 susceptibility protein-like [Holothuria leucospilota]